jgi:Fe-S-cluster containining protein
MANKSQTDKSGIPSRRRRYPDDEKRLPWLPLLLDAYAIADEGVSLAIRDEKKRRNQRLACGKGCGNCCEHQTDLPLFPHELVGIYWYVSEKLSTSVRARVKDQLAGHTPDSPCPFLIDGSCSIHPLRPVGCRQFNVFNKPCLADEDPYYTRREDVLTPLAEYTDSAFAAVIPFYNMQEKDPAAAVALIRAQIINLQTFDWGKLVAVIARNESG